MPDEGKKLSITDPESGEIVRVRWYSQDNPTDDDINSILSSYRSQPKGERYQPGGLTPAQPTVGQRARNQITQTAMSPIRTGQEAYKQFAQGDVAGGSANVLNAILQGLSLPFSIASEGLRNAGEIIPGKHDPAMSLIGNTIADIGEAPAKVGVKAIWDTGKLIGNKTGIAGLLAKKNLTPEQKIARDKAVEQLGSGVASMAGYGALTTLFHGSVKPAEAIKNADIKGEPPPETIQPEPPVVSGNLAEQTSKGVDITQKPIVQTGKGVDIPESNAFEMIQQPKAAETVIPAEKAANLLQEKIVKPLVDFYKRPPQMSDVKKITGKYLGDRQQTDLELTRQAKILNQKFPLLNQRAMARYMEAGGDESVLRGWADKTTDKNLKAVYEKALNLSDEEKQTAKAGSAQFEQGLNLAIEHDILEDGIENYFPHLGWEKLTDGQKKIISQINAGELQKNPAFAKKRIFDSFFEGEQTGKRVRAKTDTYGYGITAWFRSLNEAIASRQMLKDLMTAKEKDGRPSVAITGSGSLIPKDAEIKEAALVRSNAKPEEARDYKYIDHPALRKWKWATNDAAGNPIFTEGNMVIHPDAYGRLNAILGKSKIRTYTIPKDVPIIGGTQPGRAALNASGFIKGTILLGPFHQFHLMEHALFHEVNPLNARSVDFKTRPVLKDLVGHGMMLYNHSALSDFSEGVSSGGLLHKIPGVGNVLRQYQEWLFQDYIPRLKAEMGEAAVKRAEKYYAKDLASGKFTRDQLLENVAKQGNAAFGEQNYKYMGRNPTMQDALRLVAFAPDFLESRLKFAGQAARPYGKEQSMALLRGAIGMATLAQTANIMFGDDKKPHFEKPFSVIVNGHEYAPRSVIGDMWHLFANPRSFVYYRMNPLYVRPTIELLTGRDMYGRQSDFVQWGTDLAKSWIPIPAQGAIRNNKEDDMFTSIINTVLSSVGVSSYDAKPLSKNGMPQKPPPTQAEKDEKARVKSLKRKSGVK